jgi:hypothetical protein
MVINFYCATRLLLTACMRFFSSFLPQDKVSEFAQMTPQQLLRETQRAAGDVNLTTWHDTLITAGKELKGLQDVCAFSALNVISGSRVPFRKSMMSRND